MHPKHQQARKAVERADDAFIGNADQIDKTVSEVREKGLQDNLTVLTSAETEEKAGLAPEMDEEGSLIQEAATQLDDQSGEKSKETFNEKNSPFTPGADL